LHLVLDAASEEDSSKAWEGEVDLLSVLFYSQVQGLALLRVQVSRPVSRRTD
jgi:hypothetical protein